MCSNILMLCKQLKIAPFFVAYIHNFRPFSETCILGLVETLLLGASCNIVKTAPLVILPNFFLFKLQKYTKCKYLQIGFLPFKSVRLGFVLNEKFTQFLGQNIFFRLEYFCFSNNGFLSLNFGLKWFFNVYLISLFIYFLFQIDLNNKYNLCYNLP